MNDVENLSVAGHPTVRLVRCARLTYSRRLCRASNMLATFHSMWRYRADCSCMSFARMHGLLTRKPHR